MALKTLAVLVGLVSAADAPPEAIRYLALGDSFTICSVPRLSRHGRSRQSGELSAMSMDQAA